MDVNATSTGHYATTRACVYLLHILLQRQEGAQPGLLATLIDGVQRDRDAVDAGVPQAQLIDAIFEETLAILGRAKGAMALVPD